MAVLLIFSADFWYPNKLIISGIVNEKGKTFGIYAMSVMKKYDSGHKESWHIYRRYSDFYELQQKVRDKVSFRNKCLYSFMLMV